MAIVGFSYAISSSWAQRQRWLNGCLGGLTGTVHAVVARTDLQEVSCWIAVPKTRRIHTVGADAGRVELRGRCDAQAKAASVVWARRADRTKAGICGTVGLMRRTIRLDEYALYASGFSQPRPDV